mmetsp:Transcript_13552/g.45918  ORF Transcript_13552/g.45918 Transcript_13552/m.45918 type:complete len:204 (-) Transcript_13552:313-924(-)
MLMVDKDHGDAEGAQSKQREHAHLPAEPHALHLSREALHCRCVHVHARAKRQDPAERHRRERRGAHERHARVDRHPGGEVVYQGRHGAQTRGGGEDEEVGELLGELVEDCAGDHSPPGRGRAQRKCRADEGAVRKVVQRVADEHGREHARARGRGHRRRLHRAPAEGVLGGGRGRELEAARDRAHLLEGGDDGVHGQDREDAR